MSIGGFLDGLADSASDAYDAAADVVSDAGEAVSGAGQAVTEAATQAYDSAADAVGEAVDTAEDAASRAAAWGSHVYDQGAQALESAMEAVGLGGAEEDVDALEGGMDESLRNSGDPSEVVDLSSREKVQEFLNTYGQKDRLDSTESDMARCQSNVVIAGLLLKGGPEAVGEGLEGPLAKAEAELAKLDGMGADDRAALMTALEKDHGRPYSEAEVQKAIDGRRAALETAIRDMKSARDKCEEGDELTRGDLDRAADALLHTYSAGTDYNWEGKLWSAGLPGSVVNQMERDANLTTQASPDQVGENAGVVSWFTADRGEVSGNVWERIPPGGSAHVGVNLWGETGTGPGGEEIQHDSGNRYYYEAGGQRHYLRQNVNHAVMFGRNDDGSRFIYNPLGDPPYMSEDPNDPASGEALEAMSRRLVAERQRGWLDSDHEAKVTNFG